MRGRVGNERKITNLKGQGVYSSRNRIQQSYPVSIQQSKQASSEGVAGERRHDAERVSHLNERTIPPSDMPSPVQNAMLDAQTSGR
jgi:hypothetical protein